MQRKAVVRFLVITLGVYGALTLAWPGFGDFYARCFRAALRASLVSASGIREIEIPNEQSAEAVTRVVIVNRNLMADDGSGPVRNVDMPNSTFWNATALSIALSLATPRGWRSLAIATGAGFLTMQAFVALIVSFALWNEGRHLGLSAIAPAWEAATDRLQFILTHQASLLVPVLVWLAGLWTVFQKR